MTAQYRYDIFVFKITQIFWNQHAASTSELVHSKISPRYPLEHTRTDPQPRIDVQWFQQLMILGGEIGDAWVYFPRGMFPVFD